MALPVRERRELGRAHIVLLAQVRARARASVAAAWYALGDYHEAELDRWLDLALPLVEAAQRSAAMLTDEYVARCLERPPVGVALERVTGAAIRGGTDPREVYARPLRAVWGALSEGLAIDDAVAAGERRATQLVATDVQLTMRATLVEVARV